MRQPRRYVQKITGSGNLLLLSAFTPLHKRFALQNVGNRVLFAMMVNSGASARFHYKNSTPQGGN